MLVLAAANMSTYDGELNLAMAAGNQPIQVSLIKSIPSPPKPKGPPSPEQIIINKTKFRDRFESLLSQLGHYGIYNEVHCAIAKFRRCFFGPLQTNADLAWLQSLYNNPDMEIWHGGVCHHVNWANCDWSRIEAALAEVSQEIAKIQALEDKARRSQTIS